MTMDSRWSRCNMCEYRLRYEKFEYKMPCTMPHSINSQGSPNLANKPGDWGKCEFAS
ncbi:predicted protein [Sclerotinia sclerotiorum 1980 UF-70]|uniref:Uncharacterized protein n=1 Tax=Sclerotinia sclerotiorum (strain ATCC 18683 / 1980 / Ss-1) TaxID=665079 RepID=A7EMN9_SCLS1|nr:predicted protein [Sclerotinia sclerotiorum 1980 UF-70]EDO04105.1 predicted protein [Sclerotinia sclerotiorum 1980 UF-70]